MTQLASHPDLRPGGIRRAFTILEMLVTVGIIAIATAVILPAFSAIVSSSNFASAVNTVTATLGNARALAMRNNNYTAVAFLFDSETEVYSLITLELEAEEGASISLVATIPNRANSLLAYRPADNTVEVELPSGTGVYGYSFLTTPPSTLIDNGGGSSGPTRHWYAGEIVMNTVAGGGTLDTPWIFPRNDPRLYMPGDVDPYDVIRGDVTGLGNTQDADTALRHAQSFMIQFAPDGTVVQTVITQDFGVLNAYIEHVDLPINENDENTFDTGLGRYLPYDNPFSFDPENRESLGDDADATENPEVLLRSASLLAIVDLDDLRKGVSAETGGLSRPWLIRPEGVNANDVAPKRLDLEDEGYYDDQLTIIVSDWVDANGEIIGFNRYTGNVIRRSN